MADVVYKIELDEDQLSDVYCTVGLTNIRIKCKDYNAIVVAESMTQDMSERSMLPIDTYGNLMATPERYIQIRNRAGTILDIFLLAERRN